MTRRYRRRTGALALDLIPLVDVVFQLILFFLVSTTFQVLPGIRVNLSAAGTAEPVATGELVIAAQADGSLWVNGGKIPLRDLEKRLALIDTGVVAPADYPVRLDADVDCPSGTVVAALDALRSQGFFSVSLRTRGK
jgi:biopolymer transport protein ExbD